MNNSFIVIANFYSKRDSGSKYRRRKEALKEHKPIAKYETV